MLLNSWLFTASTPKHISEIIEVKNMKFETPEIKVVTLVSEAVATDDLPGVSGEVD